MDNLVSREYFGKTEEGLDIYSYRIKNSKGSYIEILDYSLIIKSFYTRGRDFKLRNVLKDNDELSSKSSIFVFAKNVEHNIDSMWEVCEVGEDYIVFFNHFDEFNMNATVKFRFLDFDRFVIDYVYDTKENLCLSHKISFNLSDTCLENDFRIFAKECIISNDNMDYSNVEYIPLKNGMNIELKSEEKLIHPFSEISNAENGISISIYSTMEENILSVENDLIESKILSRKVENTDAPKMFRTVYGADLRASNENVFINPFMFINR